jgi:hypothetical protein
MKHNPENKECDYGKVIEGFHTDDCTCSGVDRLYSDIKTNQRLANNQPTPKEAFRKTFKLGYFCHDMYECDDTHEEDENDILAFFLDLRAKELGEVRAYCEKQIAIHEHFLTEYDQAPFDWHRGRKIEAEETLAFVDELIEKKI